MDPVPLEDREGMRALGFWMSVSSCILFHVFYPPKILMMIFHLVFFAGRLLGH